MPAERLTAMQEKVLLLMTQGWELGLYRSWRLQEGGLGRGGASSAVHAGTASALRTRGYIRAARRDFPETVFEVTEQGRRALVAARGEVEGG